MNVRCRRSFWYEKIRLIGDVWTEVDVNVGLALCASGNCVDANWFPTIRPWPVAIPPVPLAPGGP